MIYLGINLAVMPISLGLCDDHHEIGQISVTPNHAYNEDLIIHLKSLCQINQLNLDQIQCVGITQGPGSYTGLRIGVTFAKTLCQIQQIPLYGFSTLEAFVFQYRTFDGLYLVVLPACKNEVNTALFGVKNLKINRLTPDLTCPISRIQEHLPQFTEKIYVIGDVPMPIPSPIQVISGKSLLGCTLAQMAKEQPYQNGDYKTVFPIYSHLPTLNSKYTKHPSQ